MRNLRAAPAQNPIQARRNKQAAAARAKGNKAAKAAKKKANKKNAKD